MTGLTRNGHRTSTGAVLIWLRPRAQRAIAAIALVAIFGSLYAIAPHNAKQMAHPYGSVDFSFTGAEFLFAAAAVYSCLLAVYHLAARDLGLTKSIRFFVVLSRFMHSPTAVIRLGLEREDRVAVLATLLKGFFAPMMAMSLMNLSAGVVEHGITVAGGGGVAGGFLTLFNQHGFWIVMQTILFVDVLIFTVGYLVESPRLGNEIRSVDPTLLGWGAALLCYPPFNVITSKVLGSQVSDFPQFDEPSVHVVLNAAMLTLLGIFAWASVALGLKASNLTHRGVIADGPYAYVRHPAYVCKNLAWWISSIPLVSLAFDESVFAGVQSIASVVGWSMVYVLRALTEEDHLRSVDGEYAAYVEKVRHRFVPGIY